MNYTVQGVAKSQTRLSDFHFLIGSNVIWYPSRIHILLLIGVTDLVGKQGKSLKPRNYKTVRNPRDYSALL